MKHERESVDRRGTTGAPSQDVTEHAARDHAPALAARHVNRRFRIGRHVIPVLSDINVTIEAGEWVALVGPSGSGKTTLLHLLGCLDKPDSGTVACFGTQYRQLSGRQRAILRRRTIGLLFQNYHLFPELNAVENASLPAMHWLENRVQAVANARRLLAEFGLEHRFEHRPQELSGGEQQRVALARALINDPDIILADEPTGNLDQEAAAHIMTILSQLRRSDGKTIVMVTHDLALADHADRILRLDRGTVHP